VLARASIKATPTRSPLAGGGRLKADAGDAHLCAKRASLARRRSRSKLTGGVLEYRPGEQVGIAS
jgi:hypothetical protein